MQKALELQRLATAVKGRDRLVTGSCSLQADAVKGRHWCEVHLVGGTQVRAQPPCSRRAPSTLAPAAPPGRRVLGVLGGSRCSSTVLQQTEQVCSRLLFGKP